MRTVMKRNQSTILHRAAMMLLMAIMTTAAWATDYTVTTQVYLDGVVNSSCGTASASPASGPSGTKVTLTATPNPGYRFVKWDIRTGNGTFGIGLGYHGDVGSSIGNSNTNTKVIVIGNNNVTAKAIFTDSYIVTAQANPTYGGTVQVSTDNTNWSSQVTAKQNETVYFKYSAKSGYTLDGSAPNVAKVSDGANVTFNYVSGDNPHFTMPDDDVTVTVGFMKDPYGITPTNNVTVAIGDYVSPTITNSGTGGSASASQSTHVPLETEVTLTATPDYLNGYQFYGWVVSPSDTHIAEPWSPTTTMRMPNSNVTVTAVFWKPDVITLSEGEGFNSSMASGFAGKTAQFSRTFSSGVCSTICLPFGQTPSSSLGAFYEFSGVSRGTSPWTVTMTQVTTLEAGKPYLFAPATDDNINFTGTMSGSSSATPGTTSAADATTDGTWSFNGTYATVEWASDPGNIYGYSSGQAYGSSGDNRAAGEFIRVKTGGIRPFRAYLEYTPPTSARTVTRSGENDGDALPETMTVRLIGLDGQTTGFGTINTRTGEITFDGWYTLDGHRLSGQPSQKGIYIHNGSKVAIK